MAAKDYQNKLFDAISVVAESKVKSYHYDETIEGIIKDASHADEGRYKVEYTGGVFEAYGTGEKYYENNIVYVTVPQGDFTQQKFIIGRKVDTETDPGTTFNFRMPFDDFITLRNLTTQVDPVRTKNGGAKYLANHPEHGKIVEATDNYISTLATAQTAMASVTSSWQNKMSTFTSNVNNLKQAFNDINYETVTVEDKITSFDATGHTIVTTSSHLETHQKTIETGESLNNGAYSYNGITYRQAILNVIENYVTINSWTKNGITHNWQTQSNGYVDAWNEIKTILYHFLKNVIGKNESDQTYNHLLSLFAWDDADLHAFLSSIESKYNLGHASQNTSYLSQYQIVATQQNSIIAAAASNNTNANLLWSWNDTTGQILMETKLGVSIDVQTFLGDYQPTDGQYGIRLVLTGTTKPTEDEMSREITETIYFTNDDMYGNTYGYYSPYTQQIIFDVSDLLTLTHIDCYFWQEHDDNKHVFRDFNGVKIPYQRTLGEDTILLEPNIIISNLQVLLGMTAEEATEDRVLLYCYEDKEYGIAPNEIDDALALARSDEKVLRLAWIHISNDGPILVDHEKKNNNLDINSLEYWNAKIYWYNYQYGHPLNEGIEAEKFGGVNWKPKPFNIEDQTDEFVYSTNKANYTLNVIPSREKIREKYRALVLTNNTPIRSNILQFDNRDTTIEDASFEQLYDVVFRFLKGTVSNDGTQMKIVQDNSIGNFFVYDENNDVISDEDGVAYSDIPYYVQVWIRNNETGDYSPASLDPENGIQEITWTPLGYNSMVTEFTEPSDSELENTELTPLTGSMTDEQKRLLKMITRRFKIGAKWVMKYSQNFIEATVLRKNNKLYTLQKELLFGQSGTMGSPYTIVLKQMQPDNGEMIQNQQFKITARIFERGVEKPNSKYKFEWQILSPTLITKTNSTLPSGYGTVTNIIERSGPNIDLNQIGAWWKSELNYSDTNGYYNNTISGYIRNDMPLIIKCICKNCADYPIETTVGYGLVNNNSILFNNNLQSQCPDRVEYKSDGTAPLADLMDFYVRKKRVAAQGKTAAQCGYLFQDRYDDEDEEDDDLYPQEIYPEWKLFSYYMTRTYNTETDPTTGEVVSTGIKDIILTGGPNPDTNGPSLIACLSLKPKIIDNVVITTDTGESQTIPSHVTYSLSTSNNYSYGDTTTHGNSHAPADWYWDDAYANDYYVILQWQKTINVTNQINGNAVSESTSYWFKQAIPLTLNLYSSSLVNNWNGDLLIDYDNNAIFSKMIAAGSKNKTNKFTGVMMGDWADKGDSSLNTPGLYGFKDGRQVFGFRTNGTGFIGKSGKGQIQFDGHYSLISNADRTCYINLDPVRFDYKQNGTDIRIKNYDAFSQYFLWAKSEATTKTDGSDISDFRWANKLLEEANEENKDIFAVDPNNGILTTGGIYAKYGRLGKYLLLNDSGITYKQHTSNNGEIITINDRLTNSENNDIIYIGQERTRNGTLIPLDQTERAYDHYYWSADSYKISNTTLSGYEQDETDGAVLGRYVIWAGNKTGTKAYPNFGLEHDGTVHMTNAYVQGEIHASTLIIGDEDYDEADRNRAQKTFYTNVKQLSDLIGANPALLKDRPTESSRQGLYGKGGTCHKYYGDWLRPGDVWYIHSSSMKNVTVFVGVDGNIHTPALANPFHLQYGPSSISASKFKITFANGSNFTYNETTKKISYSGTVKYLEYNINGLDQEYTTERTLNNGLNVTDLEADLKSIDTTIKTYTYTRYERTGTVDQWKKWYTDAEKAYTADPTNNTKKTTAKNYLKAYNAAQTTLQTHIRTQKTLLSKYDGVYAQLETWSANINSTNDTPLDKLSYSATTILSDKLLNQIVAEETETEQIPDANTIPNNDNATLSEQTVSSTMSYTQLVWEGVKDENNNHRWYGTWTNTNVIPSNQGIGVGDHIEENQLVWDTTGIANTITISLNIPTGQEGNAEAVAVAEATANEQFAHAGEPGYVHPQKIVKEMNGDFKSLQRFSAPPGWRIVGDVDSDSIWDALKHSTLTFNSALRATTSLLTTNLTDIYSKLLTRMNDNQEAALDELQRQRTELVTLLTNVQKDINNTVYQSAADIRSGMDPITFFDDGDCYVFLTQHPIDSNISGIGIVPAGLTIAQLPQDNDPKGVATTMHLNSKRMGFYCTYTKTPDGTPITLNGTECPVTVPLLAYYNGSMALAGSMMLGLDYNNFIYGQGLTTDLRQAMEENGGVLPETTAGVQAASQGLGLYKNVFDGPNCRIVLGNGAIVIDGLDNGKGLNGKTNEPPFPGAPNNGKQEPQEKPVAQREGIPYIYVGRNNYYNPDTGELVSGTKGVVRIGGRKNGQGMLSIADFDFSSTNYSNRITNLPTGISGGTNTLYYEQSYTRENASLIPRIKKTKNNETVTITYITSADNDGSNINVTTGTMTLTLDYYKTSNIDTWSPENAETVTLQTPYKEFEINQDSIDFVGDILAITQQCEKQTNISPRYTGIGIMGSNDTSPENAQVILGPIRYKRFEKLQNGSTVIDIKGYKDTTDLPNRCWLTGWNFYGLKVLAKNIFAAQNIVADSAFYVKNSNNGLAGVQYLKILNEYEVKKEILDAKNAVLGSLNNNLSNINTSFSRIVDTVNDFHDAFGQIGTIVKNISDSIRDVSKGVNSAFAKASAAMSTATTAIQTASEALGKAETAITFAIVSGQLTWETGVATWSNGCGYIALRTNVNPYLNDGAGQAKHIFDTYVKVPTTTHCHSIQMQYYSSNGALQFTLYGPKTSMATGSEEDSNPYYTNRDEMRFDLTTTLDTRYVMPDDLLLAFNWDSYGASYDNILCIYSENANDKIKFKANTDNHAIRINFKFLLEAYTYDKTGIEKIQFEPSNRITSGQNLLHGFNDSEMHDKGDHRGGGQEATYTLIKVWGDLAKNTSKNNPIFQFDMRYGISQVVKQITYTASEIDTKVETAFKKGWEDGWSNTYLETNFDTSTTNKFTVTAKYDTYTCQYGTVIPAASGSAANNKYLLLDIKDSDFWKKTAFGSFDYDGNGTITALAANGDTVYKYLNYLNPVTHAYLYQDASHYNNDDKTMPFRIRTATMDSGTKINEGDIDCRIPWRNGYNDAALEVEYDYVHYKYPTSISSGTNHNTSSLTSYSYATGWNAAATATKISKVSITYAVTRTTSDSYNFLHDTSTDTYENTYAKGWNDAADAVSISNDSITYPIRRTTSSEYSFGQATQTSTSTKTYNNGWAAARAKFYRSGNTVYGPSSTVGSSVSYSVSHTGYSRGYVYASSSAPSSYDARDWTTIWGNYSGTTSSYVTGWNHDGSYWVQYWDGSKWAYGSTGYAKSSYSGSTSETAWAYLTGSAKGQLTWTDP